MQSVHIISKVVSSNPAQLRRGVLDTISCDKVCPWLATGRWFSPGTLISSINKTDSHDIAEMLLKVALNTITPNNKHISRSQLNCRWKLKDTIRNKDRNAMVILIAMTTFLSIIPTSHRKWNVDLRTGQYYLHHFYLEMSVGKPIDISRI